MDNQQFEQQERSVNKMKTRLNAPTENKSTKERQRWWLVAKQGKLKVCHDNRMKAVMFPIHRDSESVRSSRKKGWNESQRPKHRFIF